MSRKRHEEEEHENHERWLVTYADMVTLLMVLFIVMFSMSAVDQKKFNELRSGLAAGFGSSAQVMQGATSTLDHPGSSAVEPVRAENFGGSKSLAQEAKKALAAQRKVQSAAEAERDRLEKLGKELDTALRRAGLQDDVTRLVDERGLVLSLTSRHVVFEPNRAELSGRGRRVLDVITPVLKRAEEDLRIDGHTNQVPVKPKYFATDWDLSSARAIEVLRHLNEVGRIPGRRLSASAFGHEVPLVDPAKAGSQRVNKRVDIVVLSDLPAAARELLDDAPVDGPLDIPSIQPQIDGGIS